MFFYEMTQLRKITISGYEACMTDSLETRTPFFDNDLVDFATRLPIIPKLGILGEILRINEKEPELRVKQFFIRRMTGNLSCVM